MNQYLNKGEWWYRVKRYGNYTVSNTGKVFSIKAGRQLKQTISSVGYPRVNLSCNGKAIRVFVHTLVLESFVGPRPEGMEACHADGSRTNNHISNLRWDTRSNNCLDRNNHGTAPVGSKNPNAKLTTEDVKRIVNIVKGKQTYREIGLKFGVSAEMVSLIKRNLYWKHVKREE